MSTGRWKCSPGLGASVDAHPLSLMIRQLVRLGMKPPEIERALAQRWWRELRTGAMPPLPSLSTLQRFVRYVLPAEERRRVEGVMYRHRVRERSRRRYREVTDDGGRVGVARTPRRAALLEKISQLTSQREAAHAQLRAAGAAKSRR